MSSTDLSSDMIVEEATINASAEGWGSEGKFQALRVECELHPGAQWLMVVEGNCETGKMSRVTGEHREIDRPRLLTFTWVRDEEDEIEILVRWNWTERQRVTTVRLTYSGLTGESPRAQNNGWPLILDLLHTDMEVI